MEIAKTNTGYTSTPITLVSFNGSNGEFPQTTLIADAAGDLLGMTTDTVFEFVNNGNGSYTLTTLANGIGAYNGGLLADAAGDLFGCATDAGTVFEITKTGTGYAASPTILASLPAHFPMAR